MTDINAYNPAYVFYGSVLSEFIRRAEYVLRLSDIFPKAKQLFLRIMNQE